jgi:hypothetical protein
MYFYGSSQSDLVKYASRQLPEEGEEGEEWRSVSHHLSKLSVLAASHDRWQRHVDGPSRRRREIVRPRLRFIL